MKIEKVNPEELINSSERGFWKQVQMQILQNPKLISTLSDFPMLDAMPIGYVVVDPQTTEYLYVNRYYARMLGYEPEEMLGTIDKPGMCAIDVSVATDKSAQSIQDFVAALDFGLATGIRKKWLQKPDDKGIQGRIKGTVTPWAVTWEQLRFTALTKNLNQLSAYVLDDRDGLFNFMLFGIIEFDGPKRMDLLDDDWAQKKYYKENVHQMFHTKKTVGLQVPLWTKKTRAQKIEHLESELKKLKAEED